MEIHISNVAKICEARITVDGLTVITGANNTGKSTIGKIIFSFFNSQFDIDNRIKIHRQRAIERNCRLYLRELLRMHTRLSSIRANFGAANREIDLLIQEIAERIYGFYGHSFIRKDIVDAISDCCNAHGIEVTEHDLLQTGDDFFTKIDNILSMEDGRIEEELIYRYFDSVFSQQILPLKDTRVESEIQFQIKEMLNRVVFDNDGIKVDRKVSITHEAYLIKNPGVIDKLSERSDFERDPADGFLLNKLSNYDDAGVFDSVIAKEKLQQIMQILGVVVPGDISYKGGKWALSSEFYLEPVDFRNLSAGIKSFVIVKMLLEKGLLKEKDVLILDEPEIHLHPLWLIKYAEIIILLQKQFDLSIIVTTHNRSFLEALDLFSQKYRIQEKCTYYYAQVDEGFSTFTNLTNNMQEIYRALVTPERVLDDLRYEIEREND